MKLSQPTNKIELLKIFRTGRSLMIDDLAREQAILADANEIDMPEEEAANLNAASFENRGDRSFFKNQYRRHARNIAQGNRFYS